MAAISISRAWDETSGLVRREAGLLVPVTLALIALPNVLLDQARPGGGAVQAAAGAPQIDLPMFIGLLFGLFASMTLSLLALRPGISVSEALRAGAQRFPVALGASLVLAAGFLLLLAPALPILTGGEGAVQRLNPAVALLLLLYLLAVLGCMIYAFPRLLLVNTVAAAERLGVLGTLGRAWALTRGRVSRFAGFAGLFFAVNLVVSLAVRLAGGTLFLGLGRVMGDPALGRLLDDILTESANAALQAWLYLMLASLYRQVALYSAGSSSGI